MRVILTRGVIQHGRVEVAEPINLPDGTEVSLAISEPVATEIDRDEPWDHTAEGVADWLRWYDALQPLVMTAREEADAEAWMRQVNARGTAELIQSTAGLFN
jgi:hypothetical protein